VPFAEGQSLSPRVTPGMLHPASMDAAAAYGVVINGEPGPTWFNYQVQLCRTPRGTWIACWTQGGYEAHPDQRVVAARSLDDGRNRPGTIRRSTPTGSGIVGGRCVVPALTAGLMNATPSGSETKNPSVGGSLKGCNSKAQGIALWVIGPERSGVRPLQGREFWGASHCPRRCPPG